MHICLLKRKLKKYSTEIGVIVNIKESAGVYFGEQTPFSREIVQTADALWI